MALTANTIFDLAGGTQSITFSNPSTADQISFASNALTFASNSTFTLSKSDFLLYAKYLSAFYTLLNGNFPGLNFNNTSWPLSSFDITHSNVGVEKVTYVQNSLGSNVYTINYLPLTTSAGFLGRSSITITTQEFFMLVLMFQQYSIQVALN